MTSAMQPQFAESTAERAALQWLSAISYAALSGADAAPGGTDPQRTEHTQPFLPERLHQALARINPHLPPEAIAEAHSRIMRLQSPTLIEANQEFHELLSEGIPVEVRGPDGVPRIEKAWLVDFSGKAGLNDLLAINQFTVRDSTTGHTDRPDIVVFINGLPLVVIECKDPGNEQTGLPEAHEQLVRYRREIPVLLAYSGLLIATDGLSARAGTITSDYDRFMPWRTVDGETIAPRGAPELETLVRGLLRPDVLLELVRGFTVFETMRSTGRDGITRTRIAKKVAGYHQYWAVKKAVRSVVAAAGESETAGRGGVVWHTQGSGKSLTMLCLAGQLAVNQELANPTVVMLTDRNDLDNQLFGVFASSKGPLREEPVQATSREDLIEKLRVDSGGLVFTTIQKFTEGTGPLSERRNIIVMADEAHRSQYGFIKGFARKVREALPHATFVGFTGTPIESADRNTRSVFGEYIDIYDIQRAIDDQATVPIYYESKLVQLEADASVDVDRAYAEALEALETTPEDARGKVRLEDLVGAPARLKLVAGTISQHLDQRQQVLEGKAMIVCMSRDICVRLAQELVMLHPDWWDDDPERGMLKVVMTGGPSDPAAFRPHAYTKGQRERLAERFKDPADPFGIAIVCDMWLTGFDVPCLHTMYLDKPMEGHSLMQAIARVNRVFGDKPGGLVVDLLGIATQLKEALANYTREGGAGTPAADQQLALPVLEEKHEIAKRFFEGFDYSPFFSRDPAKQLAAVTQGAECVLSQENGKQRFMDVVLRLSRAFAIAVPLPETLDVRDDLGYFQAVRAALIKTEAGRDRRTGVDPSPAVRQVISGAIASGEVIDIFQAAGLDRPELSILDDRFLDGIRGMQQRHLALEALRKLLTDEIRSRSRLNVVQGRSFKEMLEATLNRYRNRAIDTAQVIDELIQLARHVRAEGNKGEALKLSPEEVAFYDALATAQNVEEMKRDGTLQGLARELAQRIRENASIDWTMKETVRAQMRAMVKRLLRKYKYPPDARDSATDIVIQQAERMATNHAA
jgi:type I restriction enzyme, R subunit